MVVFCVFPFGSAALRLRLKVRWAEALLGALGVEVEADLTEVVPGALIVANHISWIDICVLNTVLPAAFIAKEEVRRWPLVGWLAARNDTIFLRRGSRGHARAINREITNILEQKKYVAVFPEGTTTDGCRLLHFHAALIQPALTAGCPVLPVAISYWEIDGSRSLAPRYDGDITVGECTGAILGRQKIIARLLVLPALGLNGEDRRQVAAAAHAAICAGIGLHLARSSLEIPAGPPGAGLLDDRPIGSLNQEREALV